MADETRSAAIGPFTVWDDDLQGYTCESCGAWAPESGEPERHNRTCKHAGSSRRVALGLTRGGEMHVTLPGNPNEPLDERTLEALRAVGEAALDRMEADDANA